MNKNGHIAASARHKDRSLLRASMAAVIAAGLLAFAAAPAQAQKVVSIGGAKRTATISVNIGKTEDVRTDTSFVDLQVGDPEIADVNPLTDKSLSILGRKSGTTRVTAYGENKKLIGVFDVEVSHDTSMLASVLSKRFPYAKLKVTSVNGRIMLSGSDARRLHARQGRGHRAAIRPGRDQFRGGAAAPAGHAGSALHRGQS